jgi:2-deoxy-D-gluconate 3-dehydrogenase
MPLVDTPSDPISQLFRLDGQVALVTGGSRGTLQCRFTGLTVTGIGASIAIALSEAGARVILAQRDVGNIRTRDHIRSQGRQCDVISCDLSIREDAAGVVDRALELVDHIDILVNNGGMLQRADSVDVTTQDWDYVSAITDPH